MRKQARNAVVKRKTKETDIAVALDLDGTGKYTIQTGMGFMDHMLETFSRHSLIDLDISAKGDLNVDFHHTVEDLGLVLGESLDKALGDKKGICRFGSALAPMDEALGECAVDLSGRGSLTYNVEFKGQETLGDFPVVLFKEFFEALVSTGRFSLHLILRSGQNAHHGIEACFKAFARALRAAVGADARIRDIPSTKGKL